MGPLRGVILILFGVLAIYRGWTLHSERAWWAYGLGAAAMALGAWHIVRNRR
jgi:hypothetical protein